MPESIKKPMELLAPAGDEASLRAAVCAGANAVYLGFSRFGSTLSVGICLDAFESVQMHLNLSRCIFV